MEAKRTKRAKKAKMLGPFAFFALFAFFASLVSSLHTRLGKVSRHQLITEKAPRAITSSYFSARPQTAEVKRSTDTSSECRKKNIPTKKNSDMFRLFFGVIVGSTSDAPFPKSGDARTSLSYRKLLYCLPVMTGITATIRRTGRSESERYGGYPCAL